MRDPTTSAKSPADDRFCHALDARKSGLKVRPEIKRQDEWKYGRQLDWRDWKKGVVDSSGKHPCRRDRHLDAFIVGSKASYVKLMISLTNS